MLLLSLPFSTAKVERIFSTLKIKNERGTKLTCSTLSDLIEVNNEDPTLSSFSADSAVDLWWSNCSFGRVNQRPRKEYRKRSEDQLEIQEEQLDLEIWDEWFHVNS